MSTFPSDFRQPLTSSQMRKSLLIRYPRTREARVNTPLSVRFCVVVVSIDMREKSESWSTKDTRKPAPVLATDSTRDIRRVCLVIEVGGMEDGCAVMPAAIDAFAACAVELLRDRAVVRVVQGFKASVSSHENLNLFLGAWAG